MLRKARDTRLALLEVGHAATELLLTRLCADVSKLMYHPRLNGDRIDYQILGRFDQHLRLSAETTLGGELPDTPWWQATTGVKHGGLGLRAGATPTQLAP